MIHAFTVDVEDYHNVIARDWLGRDGPPTRAVVENTHRLLAILAEHDTRGTFFVLGEVAETFPELVRGIAAGGHELGVHGYYHRQLFKLTPDSFRREVVDAKARIEDLIGALVQGHRAPAFSIMPETRWGLDVLADAGFSYDSSIFPIRGRRYGWPGFPGHIHRVSLGAGRSIVEVPLSTVSLMGLRVPVAGGGYLRHLPEVWTRWSLRRIGRAMPAIVYTHPYEIECTAAEPDGSDLDLSAARRLRRCHRMQLRNRETVQGKLAHLLGEFRFEPLRNIIERTMAARALNSAAGN